MSKVLTILERCPFLFLREKLSMKREKFVIARQIYQIDGNRLYPFLYLDALVDTGNGTVAIGMGCPIFDETKL